MKREIREGALSEKRCGTIELMRFVFCIVVVLWHSKKLGGTPEIALCAEAGYIGVEFFFLVSGYTMTKTALCQKGEMENLGTDTLSFLWKRIRPILPYYFLAVFFSYTRPIIVEDLSPLQAVKNLMLGVWELLFLQLSGIKTYHLIGPTWYLSALYLAMFILYPLTRKFKTTFTHIIAPTVAIFCLGFISQTYGNLDQYTNNWHIVYSGLIRALAEVSLGAVCFVVGEKIRGIKLTKFGKCLVSIIEFSGYAGVLYCTGNLPTEQFGFVMLLALAVSVTLSFSMLGVAAPLFQGEIFRRLGKISVVVYLNHMWVKDTIATMLPTSMGYWKLVSITLISVLIASLICMEIIKLLSKCWNKFGKNIYNLIVK